MSVKGQTMSVKPRGLDSSSITCFRTLHTNTVKTKTLDDTRDVARVASLVCRNRAFLKANVAAPATNTQTYFGVPRESFLDTLDRLEWLPLRCVCVVKKCFGGSESHNSVGNL